MNTKKNHRSADYAALKEPNWARYDAEKQRILREHGREAMLAFAKEEHPHDYLAERDMLDTHEVLSAKDLAVMARRPESKWEQLVSEWVGHSGPSTPDRDHEPER